MKNLTKNFLLLIITEGGSRLFGFFTTIYLARNLSVSDFGIINIGITIFAYALLFGSQWLNIYGTHRVAAGSLNNFVKGILHTKIILSFLVLIIINLFAYFFISNLETYNVVFLFTLSIIPNIFFLDWFFQGKENLFPVSVGKLIVSSVYLFFLFILFSIYYFCYVMLVLLVLQIAFIR